MPWVTADTNPKVGYRPYNTDPSSATPDGASNLCGMHGVFDPWELHGLGYLGTVPDQTTINELLAAGYDSGTLQTAVSMGASNEQLQALPYPADPIEMSDAITTLMNQLGGALPATGASAATAASYPPGADPRALSTAYGIYDLTQEATWSVFNSMFANTQQKLNALAKQFPGDPDVSQHVQDFNSTVLQYAGYYQKVFGSAPSSIPLASLSGLGSLGILPLLIVAAVAAGVLVVLAGLYDVDQWIQLKKTQTTTQATTQTVQAVQAVASNVATLNAQANALDSAGNHTGATALRNQALALTTSTASATAALPGAATSLSAWFTANFTWIALAGIGMVVAGPLAQGFFGGKRR
jgi:hypothetical protein